MRAGLTLVKRRTERGGVGVPTMFACGHGHESPGMLKRARVQTGVWGPCRALPGRLRSSRPPHAPLWRSAWRVARFIRRTSAATLAVLKNRNMWLWRLTLTSASGMHTPRAPRGPLSGRPPWAQRTACAQCGRACGVTVEKILQHDMGHHDAHSDRGRGPFYCKEHSR